MRAAIGQILATKLESTDDDWPYSCCNECGKESKVVYRAFFQVQNKICPAVRIICTSCIEDKGLEEKKREGPLPSWAYELELVKKQ